MRKEKLTYYFSVEGETESGIWIGCKIASMKVGMPSTR